MFPRINLDLWKEQFWFLKNKQICKCLYPFNHLTVTWGLLIDMHALQDLDVKNKSNGKNEKSRTSWASEQKKDKNSWKDR